MSYVSKRGRRPDEYASKISHSHIINDQSVISFLSECKMPQNSEAVDFATREIVRLDALSKNPINYIIAVDGGYTEVSVKKEYPSCKISFLQFGALTFSVEDLIGLSYKPFIDPDDMSKMKNIQRLKLSLPTKNIITKAQKTLIDSVRNTIYDFFMNEPDENKFIHTLKWFLFEEYSEGISEWSLASCPNPSCEKSNIKLNKLSMQDDYSFKCPECNGVIYMTDVFRFHEVVDNELGAGGILGYLTTLVEQIIIVHLIRVILMTKPSLLHEILFIKDGPLAFFGQTANMHLPMRTLMNYLSEKYTIYLVGLEKSGAFVEHADEIANKLERDSILILDNEYIYRYILPGRADSSNPYGRTTYYGNKIIYKSSDNYVYVATIPTREALLSPKKSDLNNIDVILTNLKNLKCDMYDCSLIPIALANKLISLSNHPSSVILEKFAKAGMGY